MKQAAQLVVEFWMNHFGDLIGIFLVLLGVAVVMLGVRWGHSGDLYRTGDGLIGAGLLAMKLRPNTEQKGG